MAKTLDEIRKKLQQLDRKPNSASGGMRDKSVYPHWNIAEGSSAILRFLPDANQDNALFWVEKQEFKLPFPGVEGQDEAKQVFVKVPCVEMWTGKNTCPILNEVRPMWKDKSLEDIARRYWIKKTYFMQGFVKQDPMNETDSPENPIRKFIIGPQIFAIVRAALMDPEMTESPVDYINGLDFIVNKTSKGGYSDYGTSKWARKETSLTDEQMDAINQYGLVDLSTYLPKRPTEEQLAIMYEMFQASINGELYDPAKWSQHYKPMGYDSADSDDDSEDSRTSSNSNSVRTALNTNSVRKETPIPSKPAMDEDDEDEVPVTKSEPVSATASASPTAGKSPQEILAMLRNRNK